MTPESAMVDGGSDRTGGIVIVDADGDAEADRLGGRRRRAMGGHQRRRAVSQVGRVFGPAGIERVIEARVHGRAAPGRRIRRSVVGIGRAVGQTGREGGYARILFALGFVTVFIGLLNLLPLPPFDGGHLAVLLIEKIRGKAVDQRRVIPVAVGGAWASSSCSSRLT